MLPADLKSRAERRARERGISFGELLRQSLAAVLSRAPGNGDSLLADKALFKGKAPKDLSSDHDKHLYG